MIELNGESYFLTTINNTRTQVYKLINKSNYE